MSTTALQLITTSFSLLNVFQPGASIPSEDAQTALTLLNNMIGQWALQSLTIPNLNRTVFPLVVGKGGPSNPYTIGPGGNFNVPKPPRVGAVVGAGVLLGNTTPAIEVPRALYDDDAYNAIAIKDLQNLLFTGVYYNASVTGGLGTVFLWPVPNTTIHSLVLYIQAPLGAFTLSGSYDLPLGYDEPIVYNLARRLQTPFGRQLSDEAMDTAKTSFGVLKRANMLPTDMPVDSMFLPRHWSSGHGYNIQTGS